MDKVEITYVLKFVKIPRTYYFLPVLDKSQKEVIRFGRRFLLENIASIGVFTFIG